MQSVVFGGIVSSLVGLVVVIGFGVIIVGAPIVFLIFLYQMLRDR